jgi:hypothetical protein
MRLGTREIEYPANTNRRGESGEINRTSLCSIHEKARITPIMMKVYIENGYDERPWIEKGRYVVNSTGTP